VCIFVAERGGRLAGVGGCDITGAITLNYVAPWARFTGTSSALLARLETELAAKGHREGRLTSSATALRFYRARGWEDAGPAVPCFDAEGQPMRKALR
jgi:hypothetical protein